MNTNYDVLNYLNLTNPRLGKMYKLTGFNPLPENFVLDEDKIKERLHLSLLAQNANIPEFMFEEKKSVKKYFKISLKNIKKLQKFANTIVFDEVFRTKIDFYLKARKEVTESILKEFKSVRFDECSAYEEIYAIDPIFADLLEEIFENDFNTNEILRDLEEKYQISYLKKIKILEEKNKKKQKDIEQISNVFSQEKNTQTIRSKTKNTQKTTKNTQNLKQDTNKNKTKQENKQEEIVKVSVSNKTKNKEK